MDPKEILIQKNVKEWNKITSLNLRHSFCLIYLATNMLEGWYIIHFKGEIHSSDIRGLWYKQKNKHGTMEKVVVLFTRTVQLW